MRISEIEDAQTALGMWKVISDNTWAALQQQAEAQERAKQERAARAKEPQAQPHQKARATHATKTQARGNARSLQPSAKASAATSGSTKPCSQSCAQCCGLPSARASNSRWHCGTGRLPHKYPCSRPNKCPRRTQTSPHSKPAHGG